MNKKSILFFFYLILTLGAYAQNPTITTLNPVQTSFCAGGNIIVQYETDGTFNTGNFFTAQLSDMWGNFSNPVNIGTIPFNIGVIPATIPVNTTFGVNYRVRVVSSNPYVVGSVSPLPPIVITSSAVSATILPVPSGPICQGDTVELYANLNESYHWSTGDTTQMINVTQSGTYRVTVTNYFTGCEVTSDDIVVTVNPLPILALGADTSICDGDVLVLDAGPYNVLYKWNNGASNAQEYYVHNTGTYFVEVKDTNNCKNYDTINVVVNQNPHIFLGNDTSFCGNVYYIDAGAGFAAYNWNNGLSLNQVLQLNNAGVYFVEVTDTNNCKAYDTVEVNIMHIPHLSLGNDLSVCGNSILLDAGAHFDVYNWNNGAGNNQYYLVTQSGLYYVMAQDSNNCIVTDTVFVDIHPVPFLFLGNDIITGDNDFIILDAGPGFASYMWSDGSQNQTLEVNTNLLAEATHTYWVCVVDENNCFNTDTVYITVDFSFSLDAHSNTANGYVYPNPFSDNANIIFKETPSNTIGITLHIYDVLGRASTFESDITSTRINLKSTTQAPGLYFYKIIYNNELFQQGRFVLER